ncbi:MAG: hypothetical protein ACXVJW_05700 [Acidimicrobiia bacterium]
MVRAEEAGILIGDFMLPGLVRLLRSSGSVVTLRIDEDVQPEESTTRHPDGRRGPTIVLVPPSAPVELPQDARVDDRALQGWVQSTHGCFGRLLVADAGGMRWLVNDADLELSLLCGPAQLVEDVCTGLAPVAPFSWIPHPPAGDEVVARYGLHGQFEHPCQLQNLLRTIGERKAGVIPPAIAKFRAFGLDYEHMFV